MKNTLVAVLLVTVSVLSQSCLQENEGNCMSSEVGFETTSEVNCEVGLCCDAVTNFTCATIETINANINTNFVFNATGVSCGDLPGFCRGTIYNHAQSFHCSCRQNCHLLGICCHDAIEVCTDIWNSVEFCEERTEDPPAYDNGCCSGSSPTCFRKHTQTNCERKDCSWDEESEECQVQCCRYNDDATRVKGETRCKSLNESECESRENCHLTNCNNIGLRND